MHTRRLPYLFLFPRNSSNEKIRTTDKEKNDAHFPGIRCPLCRWRPTRASRWVCASVPENNHNGCGTRWNTFETRGLCPGCSHQWIWTMCLSCLKASLHEAWYTKGRIVDGA